MRFIRLATVMGVAMLYLDPLPLQDGDGGSSVTGISRAFNPAISVNALFDGVWAGDADHHGAEDEHAEHEHGHGVGTETGLRVQEVELQLTSIVDAYFKADLILAFPGGEGVELEEGFVTSQSLPAGLQLKVGRFYASLGRHNLLHAHQYLFLNGPLVHGHLLGDEGLVDDGVSISWLSPLPWYLEVTGQVLDGRSERFASPDGQDLLYLGHARSFWDMGSNWTAELGASSGRGTNAAERTSSLLSANGTLQWRDLDGWGRRAIWQTEYLRARDGTAHGDEEEGGFYSSLQVQVARRWWLQARFDRMGIPGDEEDWRLSTLLGFVPSEFSSIRVQADRQETLGETSNTIMLQLNVTIGSHPAHRY